MDARSASSSRRLGRRASILVMAAALLVAGACSSSGTAGPRDSGSTDTSADRDSGGSDDTGGDTGSDDTGSDDTGGDTGSDDTGSGSSDLEGLLLQEEDVDGLTVTVDEDADFDTELCDGVELSIEPEEVVGASIEAGEAGNAEVSETIVRFASEADAEQVFSEIEPGFEQCEQDGALSDDESLTMKADSGRGDDEVAYTYTNGSASGDAYLIRVGDTIVVLSGIPGVSDDGAVPDELIDAALDRVSNG